MKKRLMALLAAFCMTVSMIGSGTVVSAAEQKTKDEVIVTMPATSEPEAGFDPAYGWGAGYRAHLLLPTKICLLEWILPQIILSVRTGLSGQ